LPTLSKDEDDWKNISTRREELETEKAVGDKARQLAEGIAEDEQELERRDNELASLRKSVEDLGDIESKIQEAEAARADCDEQRQRLLAEVARLKATVQHRTESSEKDRRKLAEIEAAGPEGSCPTCEQKLKGAYELLMKKLRADLNLARHDIEQSQKSVADLESQMKGLANKDDALKRKRARLDQDRVRIDKARATASARETEISTLTKRLDKKRKELESLGEIKFKPEEYRRVLSEQERLKRAHDDYLNLKNLEGQIQNLNKDLAEVNDRIARTAAEAEKYRGLLEVLEPEKNAYDSVVQELDAKNANLVAAKERVGKLSSGRERARADLERVTKELAEIQRVKKAIENDRRMEDDLSVLEEIVVNFRVHLIGKIKPALASLTSRSLGSMTDGRYSKVELDENYEMQIDDQGTMYPVSRFSGGESDLANLCLRLAISEIIADRTGANPINILILDEIFGSLDPSRKRSVMAALSRFSGHFRQVFLITHIEDIKDLMNHIIRVQELEDGSSGAELVS
jgi:exonuclease SbcC